MPAARRRLLRSLSLPGFALGAAGWLQGLLVIDATASMGATLAATTCGLIAISCLGAWFGLRPTAARG